MTGIFRYLGLDGVFGAAEERTSTLITCVKNEGPYLLEWIAFHKVCGFDEIIIYDNGSTDGTEELLRPLAKRREIVYRTQPDMPNVPPQSAAGRDAAARCTTTWLAMLDADEFLVLHDHPSINDYLASFGEDVSQISINWRLFGSAGQTRKSEGLVIERFQMASAPDNPKNAHTKSITRTNRFQNPNVHAPFITGGLAVHADGQPRWMKVQGITGRISHQVASIHHYAVKSREEFQGKIARGRGAVPVGKPEKVRRNPEDFFRGHDTNVVKDTAALVRIDEVRAEVRRLRRLVEQDTQSAANAPSSEMAMARAFG